ncbi:unnamed protein product [Sphenostylis stenocarpa]|uniref:RING-type E3 ubiquitin transferase n=1 Tax=Sphenostylis stenocarpa TaxID=92480 RepID=A0AA86VV61_9FABA|nr:unnamed protein product [Sphenostylis stenocarpa]
MVINMTTTEERRISFYRCLMRVEETRMNVKPTDRLRIDVTISVRYQDYLHIIQTSTLLKRLVFISCQSFLENNKDFLRSLLFDPSCSHCFIPEIVDLVSERILNMTQQILGCCRDTESVDSECQEFSLNLDIIVDIVPDVESEEEEEEIENAVTEESMQQDAAMIPASSEAIHSLTTFTDFHFLKRITQKCNICLEKFRLGEDEEKVKFSWMPCDHAFHHHYFLSILVLDPPYSNFFAPESIDEVSGTIRTLAEEIFEFCSDTESSEYQEFPLKLDIIVDLVPAEDTVPEEESEEEEEEIDNAVIEESMQQDAAMIPASSEAIHSLKTFTILPSSKRRTEECNICLEQFRVRENEENVKFSSMPCHHVFHHYCIVKWLQISHTCPLCRYPMPTEN